MEHSNTCFGQKVRVLLGIILLTSMTLVIGCNKPQSNDANESPKSTEQIPPPAAARSAGNTSGLVGYYPLDNHANDMSGNNNHGVIVGTLEQSEDHSGQVNGAYAFDGQNVSHYGYIQIPNSLPFHDMESFTIAAWIYPTVFRKHNSIISKVNPNRDFCLKLNETGLLEAHFALGSKYYRINSQDVAVQLNRWTHVAATWSSPTWTLFVDGQLVAERDYPGVVPGGKGTSIGIGMMNRGELFSGGIDDVRIYNRALSEAEISALAR